jgi:hypothetical protein
MAKTRSANERDAHTGGASRWNELFKESGHSGMPDAIIKVKKRFRISGTLR